MKNFLLIRILLLLPLYLQAQSPAYELSDPIPGIPLTGWNKVLQVRNGNTVMVHFEPRKEIVVNVFDKEHKLIASRKHICALFDINNLENTAYKGFYDINGEAVLFLQQAYNNHLTLFRLRLNAENGTLIKEEPAVASPSFNNPVYCYVTQLRESDGYAVLMVKNLPRHPNEQVELGIWNKKHERIKTVAYDIPTNDLNALRGLGIRAEGSDIYTSLRILRQDKRGQFHQFVLFARMAAADSTINSLLIEMPAEGEASYTLMSYNDFSQKENLYITMLGITEHMSSAKFTVYEVATSPYFAAFTPYSMTTDSIARVSFARLDTSVKDFSKPLLKNNWKPIKMYTYPNGVTMVAYEQMTGGYDFAKGKYYPKTYLGNIGLCLLDEYGTELLAFPIPKRQRLNSYYYYPGNVITSRNYTRYLFDQWPENAYNSQFASFDMVTAGYDSYILFNDNKLNFDIPAGEPLNDIDNYDYSNAVCYQLNRKKELSKNMLFGPVEENEYKACMLESAHYDKQTGVYAVLMLHRQGKNVETRLAWVHFSPAAH